MKSEQRRGEIKFIENIFWIGLAIGMGLRLWLAANHFPHYDDLWGMYRAVSIKGMDANEFVEKLPSFSQEAVRILVGIDAADWLLRHIASIKEATYMTTLAPLHYAIALVPVGIANSYKEALLGGRITTLLEYLIFILLAMKLCGQLENSRRRIYQFYIALTLFGGLPLFYSAQGHNYMGGVAATVIYITTLNQFSSSKTRESLIRAGMYCLMILTSYTFIIYLPAYIACELIIMRRDKELSKKEESEIEGRVSVKKTKTKTRQKVAKTIILLAPIILSIALKEFYIMQVKDGSLGVGWNSGLNNEYIVNYQDARKFLEYFWEASKITISALFLPTVENKFLNQVLGGTTILFIIIGIYDYIKSFRVTEKKLIDAFAITSILTTIGFYLIGKIAISPTRHSLTLILFIALIASRGGIAIYSAMKESKPTFATYKIDKRIKRILKTTLISTVMVTIINYYWGSVKSETLKRVDALDSSILDQMRSYDKIYISGYRNFSLATAPELIKMEEEEIGYITWIRTKKQQNNTAPRIAYFSNDPRIIVEQEIENKIKVSEKAVACKASKVIKEIISTTTPDLAPEPLTPIGTNTIRAYEVECMH